MTRETKSYDLNIYDQSLMRFEAAYDAFGSLKLEITDIDSANAHCFGGTVTQVVAHLTVGAASVPKGFGSTAIQAVVHQEPKPFRVSTRFGGTVIQVVVHQRRGRGRRRACFGGTVNQAVVHRC